MMKIKKVRSIKILRYWKCFCNQEQQRRRKNKMVEREWCHTKHNNSTVRF